MAKYKPCCREVCGLGLCETREAGGCYCVCRLKDMISNCKDLLSGRKYRKGDFVIYDKKKHPPLKGEAKAKEEEKLKALQEKLKTYVANHLS